MAPGLRLDILGPAPQAPPYTLVGAATVIAEGNDRWLNGATEWPFPCGKGQVRNFCSGTSGTGSAVIAQPAANPGFDVIEALAVFECYAAGLNEAEWRQRAIQAFEAQESALVAEEFQKGTQLPNNPHLTDANVSVLNGGAATNMKNGLALLEKAIASKQRRGMIHVPVGLASGLGVDVDREAGKWMTKLGSIIVPDAGYDGATAPTGGTAATGTQDWAYATGLVEMRRSEVEVVGGLADWLDRSSNAVRIHVHRYYLVTADLCVQAAVKIDRCQTAC